MDRDSLLPPALSESLHIPPLWLPTDHDLNGGGPRIAFEKKVHKFQMSRTKLHSFFIKRLAIIIIKIGKYCKSYTNVQYCEKNHSIYACKSFRT